MQQDIQKGQKNKKVINNIGLNINKDLWEYPNKKTDVYLYDTFGENWTLISYEYYNTKSDANENNIIEPQCFLNV